MSVFNLALVLVKESAAVMNLKDGLLAIIIIKGGFPIKILRKGVQNKLHEKRTRTARAKKMKILETKNWTLKIRQNKVWNGTRTVHLGGNWRA